jgi:protein phosphatase
MEFLIIGDVHGGYTPFKRAIDFARENDLHLISVGDLIDNGPDGDLVVSNMLSLLDKGYASVVKGNHEHKIIRYLNGANVILGPPNMVTTEQFKTNKTFEADFRRMVDDYAQNFIKLEDDIFVTHAGMHPDFWKAEASNTEFTRRMTDEMMFGQANYKITYKHAGQTYPARTYEWRHSVPSGVTLFVGHDPAPLTEKPDFDNFQPKPLDFTNEQGGRVIWLDCGAGKGGDLFGAVVNSATKEKVDFINFGKD